MRSCKCTSHDLYAGGCQWQWQVCVSDTLVSVCMSRWVRVSLRTPHCWRVSRETQNVRHRQVLPDHAVWARELSHLLLVSIVIGSHVSYLILEKSRHRSGTQHHSFGIRLSFTTSTKYSWWVNFSKRFLLVHVVWDFSLTDFPPACWVTLAFLFASPCRILPFTHFVGFAGITTSQTVFRRFVHLVF
jgi:hypothetical protein